LESGPGQRLGFFTTQSNITSFRFNRSHRLFAGNIAFLGDKWFFEAAAAHLSLTYIDPVATGNLRALYGYDAFLCVPIYYGTPLAGGGEFGRALSRCLMAAEASDIPSLLWVTDARCQSYVPEREVRRFAKLFVASGVTFPAGPHPETLPPGADLSLFHPYIARPFTQRRDRTRAVRASKITAAWPGSGAEIGQAELLPPWMRAAVLRSASVFEIDAGPGFPVELASVEAAACGCVVVSTMRQSRMPGELPVASVEIAAAGSLELRRIAQQQRRAVIQHHALDDRLATMLRSVGLPTATRLPTATIVCATMRPSLLDRIWRNFVNQEYPAKQLIIVVNTVGIISSFAPLHSHSDLTIITIPSEQNVGICLNMGAHLATDEYLLKMDDDDDYGKNYINDFIAESRITGCDIFGKPTGFFAFEGDDGIWLSRRAFLNEYQVFLAGETQGEQLRITGASIGGKTSVFRDLRYSSRMRSANDIYLQSLQRNTSNLMVAAFDAFNTVIARREEIGSHSWRAPAEDLKRISLRIGEDKAAAFV
jgi:hypothetical protein